ncbi:molybdenum cofactor biosynthesis protein MoaE [Candidatus Poribacteria bacterium]|nr:molybdenum cofactor biosynthesis protein MoaE [Candidatus Poribacteria bacterium]
MIRCWMTSDPIDESAVRALVDSPSSGAIVVFLGIVRNHAEGRAVAALEYEAYEPMAVKTLTDIASEAASQWNLDHAAVVHRAGRLKIGEASVAIAVSSAHRAEAFAACAQIMDRIKQDAPIWKREIWADGGERWVGDDAEDR